MKVFALVVLYCFAEHDVSSYDAQCRNRTSAEQFETLLACQTKGDLEIADIDDQRPLGWSLVVCPEYWSHEVISE